MQLEKFFSEIVWLSLRIQVGHLLHNGEGRSPLQNGEGPGVRKTEVRKFCNLPLAEDQ